MKFITNNFRIVSGKSKIEALKAFADMYNYPDYKIYFNGNNPELVPFIGSKHLVRVHKLDSAMGKSLLECSLRYLR